MKPIFPIFIFLLLSFHKIIGQDISFEISNFEAVNTSFSEIHAIPNNKEIYVTSARNKEFLVCKDPELKNELYTDIYSADQGKDGQFESLNLVDGQIKKKYHNAVPVIHPNGKMMVFTRSHTKSLHPSVLQLYSATLQDGQWTNIQSLPFNSEDFSNLHPTFSPDGTKMIFASTQTKNKAESDLYMVEYNNGEWGNPLSLGSNINTNAIEYFPHWSADNTLYFSSDGHNTNGGLDIFQTFWNNGSWTSPISLPEPINTSSDDFAYVTYADGLKGYFASNRDGGIGNDDIYRWSKIIEEPKLVNIIVTNSQTNERLSAADVIIIPVDDKIIPIPSQNSQDFISDENNPIVYAVVPEGKYLIKVNKSGFKPLEININTDELEADDQYELPITPESNEKLVSGKVINVQTLNPISNANVIITNKCNNETHNIITDGNGYFEIKLDDKCDYDFLATKPKLVQDNLNLSHNSLQNNTPDPVYVTLKLAPVIKEGLVIKLDDIYYDLDKAFIRPDAALELDKIVRLMERYPSLKIELRSHTDARGKDSYNLNLSQRRATSAVQYIISKGINSDRLIAKGYGETLLVNHCADNVKCSEEEHQANRRTEIKVTELNEPDVSIQSN